MKTPKRDCDWCNNWELEHCGRSWCGDCERGKRMFAQSARWIRKNREARLRHALQRQAWNAVMLAADMRCATLSARYWKKRYRDIWLMPFCVPSTYGQDVEGS